MAIFAASNQIAIGVIKAYFEYNLKIPDDISVIGYYSIPISEDLHLKLTTVNQLSYKAEGLAVEVLLNVLREKQPVQRKSSNSIEKTLDSSTIARPIAALPLSAPILIKKCGK